MKGDDVTLMRVYAEGAFDVELAAEFLNRMSRAYKSLLFLDNFVSISKNGHLSTYKPHPLSPSLITENGNLNIFIEDDRLKITEVEFHSPGFWEFLGKLNPLEVLRQYLNDRHERGKDKEYRNSNEALKMDIERRILELDYIQKVIETAKMSGHSDEDIRMLIQEHALIPLLRLDSLSELGLATRAEMPKKIKVSKPEPKPVA